MSFWELFFDSRLPYIEYVCYIIYIDTKHPKMNKTEALQTAETIFKQFGGQHRLKFFVGANTFGFLNRALINEIL